MTLSTTQESDKRDWKTLYRSGALDRDIEGALQSILEDEKRYPNDFDILGVKAVLLGRLGKSSESIIAADAALKLRPYDHEMHNAKGLSHFHLGNNEEALAAFNACLSFKPHFPVAAYYKIFILASLERFDDAVKFYEESDLPDLFYFNWLNTLGYIYFHAGNLDRAKSFLTDALKANPFSSAVHYNLAQLNKQSKKILRFLTHKSFFLTFLALEKTDGWQKLVGRIPQLHITEAKYFCGSGTLYLSPPERREWRAIMQLLKSLNAPALGNNSWEWFAVNVPYDAVEQNGFRGDVDIIVKRPDYFTKQEGLSYRSFQVKTISVSRTGKIKSAKSGETHLKEMKNQLEVLRGFGCEEVFFLEIFILERGYTMHNTFPSARIDTHVMKKKAVLASLGYGYIVAAIEPAATLDEESGGVWHPLFQVISPSKLSRGAHFQKLVEEISQFLSSEAAKNMTKDLKKEDKFGTKVGYCYRCKKLTMLLPVRTVQHICGWCKGSMY